MQTKYPPLLSAARRSHTLSSRLLILALVCRKSECQSDFCLYYMRNCCGCFICYLAFFGQQCWETGEIFLVFSPQWREFWSSEYKPWPHRQCRTQPRLEVTWRLSLAHCSPPPPAGTGGIRSRSGVYTIQYTRASNQSSQRFHNHREVLKAHTGAFSRLKAPISAFKFKTLSAHLA